MIIEIIRMIIGLLLIGADIVFMFNINRFVEWLDTPTPPVIRSHKYTSVIDVIHDITKEDTTMTEMKAVYVRMGGDPAICAAIQKGMESSELKQLRRENAILRAHDAAYWKAKSDEAYLKYGRVLEKRKGYLHHRIWSDVGYIIAMIERCKQRRKGVKVWPKRASKRSSPKPQSLPPMKL